ncbi:MAG: 50S ribosomal protein L11 methyltransferase [Candidatus Azobacteroides sp.]|nr:50S ribosomal protein L11 methyltransferase [Candidatus Azobacteroides sp.]
MNYYEIKFTIDPNTETNRDVLAAVLAAIGFESFTENTNGIDAYIPEKSYNKENLKTCITSFPIENTTLNYTVSLIETKDWNEEWEKNFFQPIIINDLCVIHSSFHQNIPQLPYDIVIDPKMAFGTGHHETTSLMISFLLETDVKNKSFLDMGCGTAVLAILAKMKGANPVIAIDIDEWAYNNSIENIKLNNTPNIDIRMGGVEILGEEKFDVIFANINRNILLSDIHVYASCMKAGSELFMSGFYTEDMEMIKDECLRNNLRFISYVGKNNWVAIKTITN